MANLTPKSKTLGALQRDSMLKNKHAVITGPYTKVDGAQNGSNAPHFTPAFSKDNNADHANKNLQYPPAPNLGRSRTPANTFAQPKRTPFGNGQRDNRPVIKVRSANYGPYNPLPGNVKRRAPQPEPMHTPDWKRGRQVIGNVPSFVAASLPRYQRRRA